MWKVYRFPKCTHSLLWISIKPRFKEFNLEILLSLTTQVTVLIQVVGILRLRHEDISENNR